MIVVRIWEGLGNQLFQYAYARALQLRTRRKVYINYDRCYQKELEGHRICRKYGLCNFNIKMEAYDSTSKIFFFLRNRNFIEKIVFYLSQREHALVHFYKETTVDYKEELKIIRGNYYMMGWFQNEKYFKEYRKQLLKELSPKRRIKISHHLKEILTNENTVSVHIRRGDYRTLNNVLPITYYNHAIDLIEKKLDNPYYVVFTDDIEWTRNNILLPEKCYYVSDEKLQDYEELWVMTRCKHNIIANSTFSWWGAWLNSNEDKIVIGPEKWFFYGNNKIFNIMPNEWLRISI